jgi:hypothetical protein
LFTVADRVLELIESKGGVLGLLELAACPLPQGDAGAVPTEQELEEAVTLLIRLGFIERVDRSGSA